MAELTKCDVCKKPAQQKCAKCWKVFYCSKEHQTLSWKAHKKVCRPFEICINERFGRHVVATKPIKEGDVVLRELPLITGPDPETFEVCLGCLKPFDINIATKCEKCGWPLCSKECQNSSDHKPECYYAVKWRLNVSNLPQHGYLACVVNILRCLYQKKFHFDIWKKITSLESHPEKSEANMLHLKASIASASFYEIFGFHKEFSNEEIEEVYRIMGTNSFSVSSTEPSHMALYETSSLFQHCCKANCVPTFDSKRVRVIAGVPIKQGDSLSFCYIDPLFTTPKRQEYLRINRLFKCECERCSDITEFGTNYSAIKCENTPCDGLLLPESFLIEGLPWKCNKCAVEISDTTAAASFERMDKLIENMQSAADIKEFLETLKEDHWSYMHLKLNCRLISMIENPNRKEMTNEDVNLQIKLCREVLDVSKTLAAVDTIHTVGIIVPLLVALLASYETKLQECTISEENLKRDIVKDLRQVQDIGNNILYETNSIVLKVVALIGHTMALLMEAYGLETFQGENSRD